MIVASWMESGNPSIKSIVVNSDEESASRFETNWAGSLVVNYERSNRAVTKLRSHCSSKPVFWRFLNRLFAPRTGSAFFVFLRDPTRGKA